MVVLLESVGKGLVGVLSVAVVFASAFAFALTFAFGFAFAFGLAFALLAFTFSVVLSVVIPLFALVRFVGKDVGPPEGVGFDLVNGLW